MSYFRQLLNNEYSITMKKLFLIIALLLAKSAFSQNAIMPTYFLNDRVGFVNYMVATNMDAAVERTSSSTKYKESNPFYEFSINSSIMPFGKEYQKLKQLLQLRAIQIYMDTVNFQSKITNFKNKEDQQVYYVEEEVAYYKGKELKREPIVVDDSSLINMGYRYVAFVVPKDTTIQESMFLSLDVLPVFATFKTNDEMIMLKVTGWDIIRTFHLNTKKYLR